MATVKCDVCAGIFSDSYLASHKRLAHNKDNAPPEEDASSAAPATEKEAIQRIVSLYERLSSTGRKRVVDFLTAKAQKVQKDQKTL